MAVNPQLPLYERDSSARSSKVEEPDPLAPIHLYKKKGSKFPEGFSVTLPPENELACNVM